MRHLTIEPLWLDYGAAADSKKLLPNLSGVASAGDVMWTVSDEGRTIECLAASRHGFALRRQIAVDDIFAELPGRDDGEELDLESLDVAGGRLWISGSHCRVRRESKERKRAQKGGRVSRLPLDSEIRPRPSRHLLGAVRLDRSGEIGGEGAALPPTGKGSLRRHLAYNPFVEPFAGLPSKENGIDVEGILVFRRRVLIGLRGPLVDNIALVAEIGIAPAFAISKPHATHFVDLQGLSIRDLTRWKDKVLILAGPVSQAGGPFRIFQWRPRHTDRIQPAELVYEWEETEEHPEGMCLLARGRSAGLVVLYDSPGQARMRGSRYRADWLRLPG